MLRIDASTLRSPEETEEGYIRAEGIIAAPGVLEYRTKGGETVREYVPEETLRDEEFLQSLEDKPVTLEHPPEKVDPDNVQRHEVGNVRDVEWIDDGETKGAKGTVVLRSSDAIEAFKSGTDELSPAYEVELEEGDGQNFDRIQAKRRAANHVALTKQGRAGAKARLRADSDAVDASLWHADAPKRESLGAELSARIREMTDADTTQRNILQAVRRNIPGDRSLSTLRDVVAGDIQSPPDQVLEAFANVLDTDVQTLKQLTPDSTPPSLQGDAMPPESNDSDSVEKIRLDSERFVRVDEQTAQTIRSWKQDQEEEKMELSSEIESAQEEIQQFKDQIDELKSERDELDDQIAKKRKQLERLAEKIGLKDMLESDDAGQGESATAGVEGDQTEPPSPSADAGMSMPDEPTMDSMITERIDSMCRERMDALEAAEMLGLEVDDDTSTTDIKADVVEEYFDDRSPDRSDSAQVTAHFDAAVDMLEERADERDESYDSASSRADADDGPDPKQEYRNRVFG